MKASNAAEDFNEDLLGNVGSIGRVRQAARNQRVQRLMILGDQHTKGFLAAGLQLGDEHCLFCCDAYRACEISHDRARLHTG